MTQHVKVSELLRKRLDLTPERVMALLLRIVAPDTVPHVREECLVRGVSEKTLKAMTDAREIRVVIGGSAS